MNNSWAFSVFAAPAMLGALLSHGVELYADVTTDDASVVSPPAPVTEHSANAPELRGVHEVQLGALSPTPDDDRRWSVRDVAVTEHESHVYLALRRTPVGESTPSWVQVFQSHDERNWTPEFSWVAKHEVQGPELLSLDGQLRVYFSGSSESEDGSGVHASTRTARGWSEPQDVGLPEHRLSQLKLVSSTPLMTTIVGRPGLYRMDDDPLEVRMLTTRDGLSWRPLLAGQSAVYRGGGDDAAFQSGDDGNLLAVVRNEAGDASGWGSSVCMAPSNDWTSWDCVNDPKHYGAAEIFTYDGAVHLVGQRQLSDDGEYDTKRGWGVFRAASNQLEALTTGKRCALWRYEPSTRTFGFVMDLPSRGDVCSPAVLQRQDGQLTIYGHSSDLTGPDLAQQPARQQPNHLYRYGLAPTPRHATHTVSYTR